MANLREMLGINDLFAKNGHLWKALLAEFLADFFLTFLGCASGVSFSSVPHSTVLKSFAGAFLVFVLVMSIGHVSGAHISCAVTAGMLVTGNIPIIKGVLYIIVQCLGCVTGTAVLKVLTPESIHEAGLGVTVINPNISPLQGCAVEFFLAFLLVFVVFAVLDQNRPETKPTAALAIAFAVGLGHLAVIDFTGASMNPARSFGPALITNSWANHWVYWVGPILGGISGALLYQNVFEAPKIVESYTRVATEEKELKRLDGLKQNDLT